MANRPDDEGSSKMAAPHLAIKGRLPLRCSITMLSFSLFLSLLPSSLSASFSRRKMRGKRQSPAEWCVDAGEQAGERARIARWGREKLRAKELTSCAGKRPLFRGGSEPTRRGGRKITERAQRSRNRRSKRAMACSRDDGDGLW
ncbi:hypothetical protein V8C26DRAFT_259606 [Trichoderma gracile]